MMFHVSGLDDDSSEIVTEHPLGTALGAVDRDNAESGWASLLDTCLDDASGLTDIPSSGSFFLAVSCRLGVGGHLNVSIDWKG